MILPTKYITIRHSILGVGALIIEYLDKPRTVSYLWEKTKDYSEVKTFERFIMGLDFLYIIGAIELKEGLITICHR